MKNTRLAVALATALAVTAPALTAAAQAPSKAQLDEAGTRFKKGLELFKEGDYQAALIEFRRANELAPNFNVLYNIGQVYFQLQDYANALTTLERYLAEGGSKVPAARRAEVEKDIEKLKGRVSNLEIAVNVEGADVAIDDVVVGRSPLAKPILVSAGRHKITVSKSGMTPASKVLEIASAEKQKVSLELAAANTATPAPTPPIAPTPEPTVVLTPAPTPAGPAPDQPAPAKKSWGGAIAGWVITGALAGGAAVTGVMALGASEDLKTLRASADATRPDLDSQASKTQTFAILTDVMAAGSLVAAGVSIYLTVSTANANAAAEKKAAKGFSPTVKLGVLPGGLSLSGTF